MKRAAMKKIVVVAGLVLLTAGSTPAVTAQQQKMKDCNAQATQKGLKGEERQKFMSSCLSAEGGEKALNPQQEKMKTCNAQASQKGLEGDERKTFMSKYLSGE
jgi:hypothetical protein